MEWFKGSQLKNLGGNGITMSFKYDNNGIRTSKTVNGVKTVFTYVGDMLISQKTGNETINFFYTAGGAPYGFTYNGTNYLKIIFIRKERIMSNRFTDTAAAEYILEEIKNGKYTNPLTAMGLLKQIINDLRGTSVAKEAEEVLKKYRES
ncbi:MAG: hypothetical protein IJ395_03480 [Clostridia bacterium]|nr:hypothetical protein [Clostridia bacterium]